MILLSLSWFHMLSWSYLIQYALFRITKYLFTICGLLLCTCLSYIENNQIKKQSLTKPCVYEKCCNLRRISSTDIHNIDAIKYDTIYRLERSNTVAIVTEHRESPLSTSITLAYNVTSATVNNEIFKWVWICHIHKYSLKIIWNLFICILLITIFCYHCLYKWR